MSNKEKSAYDKIRKTWSINPRERIVTNKEVEDSCEKCGFYKSDPEICLYCEGEGPIKKIPGEIQYD